PFFSGDMEVEEILSHMWTTQVLFPRSSRDNSHATLLPANPDDCDSEENDWAFTYDTHFETFRAVRVDDLRNGHTYFSAPSDGKACGPTTLPAPSLMGTNVAVGFGGKRVWVYGVPGKLDLEMEGNKQDRNPTNVQTTQGNSQAGLQILGERNRNSLVRGRQICEIPGLAGLKFVSSTAGDRLVAVASGGVS